MRVGLVLLAIVALLARGLVFTEGGTVGAWGCLVVFCLSLAIYLVATFRDDVLRREPGRIGPIIRWGLVATCIAAFAVGGRVDDSTVEAVARGVFYLSLLSAVALSIRERRITSAAARSR